MKGCDIVGGMLKFFLHFHPSFLIPAELAEGGNSFFFLNHTLKGVVNVSVAMVPVFYDRGVNPSAKSLLFPVPPVIPAFTKYCEAQAGISYFLLIHIQKGVVTQLFPARSRN